LLLEHRDVESNFKAKGSRNVVPALSRSDFNVAASTLADLIYIPTKLMLDIIANAQIRNEEMMADVKQLQAHLATKPQIYFDFANFIANELLWDSNEGNQEITAQDFMESFTVAKFNITNPRVLRQKFLKYLNPSRQHRLNLGQPKHNESLASQSLLDLYELTAGGGDDRDASKARLSSLGNVSLGHSMRSEKNLFPSKASPTKQPSDKNIFSRPLMKAKLSTAENEADSAEGGKKPDMTTFLASFFGSKFPPFYE